MRRTYAALAIAASAVACVSYALPPEPDAGASADAGPPPAVTVTTLAAPSSTAPGGKVSAAWAAWQLDGGPWQPMDPRDVGTYGLPRTGTRWSVAFACDDPSSGSSTIAIYERPGSVTSLEVLLPDPCTLQPPSSWVLSGNLTNLPAATSWLEFGYALESRGSALPVSGTTAPYELVNVVGGTWDVAFGVRDTSSGSLTRVAILRARAIDADLALDVDLAGASAFAPGQKALVVHGATAEESVAPLVSYATGGTSGIALGPQDVPVTPPDLVMAYSTVPAAAQAASDRYRIDLAATLSNDGPGPARAIAASFHDAVDVDLTLPDAFPVPAATFVPAAPSRVATTFALRAGVASYLVDIIAATTRRSQRRFVTSVDASLATGTETMPDLASVPGFHAEWTLPSVDTSVTVTAIEADLPLGDGAAHRAATAAVRISH